MKVTIITATYNSAKTLTSALQSVAMQDYNNIEHIIIDGESKDNTLGIVNQFQHITKIVSEKDGGIYDAMNKGIALSSGDIIGILNSDDFYTSSTVISEIVQKFKLDNEIDCVYANLDYVDKDDVTRIIRKWRSGLFKENSFYMGWMPPHPTFFVKKTAYDKYGKFNLQLRSAADYELMLRFLFKHKCKCGYLDKTIVKMRTGGISNKNIIARIKANLQDAEAWKLNGLKPKFYTMLLKPLRKIIQYF